MVSIGAHDHVGIEFLVIDLDADDAAPVHDQIGDLHAGNELGTSVGCLLREPRIEATSKRRKADGISEALIVEARDQLDVPFTQENLVRANDVPFEGRIVPEVGDEMLQDSRKEDERRDVLLQAGASEERLPPLLGDVGAHVQAEGRSGNGGGSDHRDGTGDRPESQTELTPTVAVPLRHRRSKGRA